MSSESRLWLVVLAVAIIVAGAEVWLVHDFQLAHSISDESVLGGPVLAFGSIFLLISVAGVMAKRFVLAAVTLFLALLSFSGSYVLLVQW